MNVLYLSTYTYKCIIIFNIQTVFNSLIPYNLYMNIPIE